MQRRIDRRASRVLARRKRGELLVEGEGVVAEVGALDPPERGVGRLAVALDRRRLAEAETSACRISTTTTSASSSELRAITNVSASSSVSFCAVSSTAGA